MNIIITGASGFTGKHMIHYLKGVIGNDDSIYGLSHSRDININEECEYFYCDLLNKEIVGETLSSIKPDIIVHLAGRNSGTLQDLLNTNCIGTKNLLEAIYLEKKHPRTLIIGSSAEYGYPGCRPIDEATPIFPVSDYGISKAGSSFIASKYNLQKNLPIAIARPFNIIGPGQPSSFVCGKITEQIAIQKKKSIINLSLGNIDSKRDFIDVRDVVRAYWAIISDKDFFDKCNGKIFNIGTGTSYSIREIFAILDEMSELNGKIRVNSTDTKDPIPYQSCDNSLLKESFQWNPNITIKKTLIDMIEWYSKKHHTNI